MEEVEVNESEDVEGEDVEDEDVEDEENGSEDEDNEEQLDVLDELESEDEVNEEHPEVPDKQVSENEDKKSTIKETDAVDASINQKVPNEEIISLRNELEQMKKQFLETQQIVKDLSAKQAAAAPGAVAAAPAVAAAVAAAAPAVPVAVASPTRCCQRCFKTAKNGPIPSEIVDPEDSKKGQMLESKFQELTEHINNLQSSLTNQIDNIQEQANDIESGLGLLTERVNIGGGGTQHDFVGLDELYKKVEQINCDLEILSNTSSKLMHDSEQKNNLLQSLTMQVESLETSKADREEMDEALHDKADATAVKRKVSHEQFENALEHLSLALHEAVKKLTEQEVIWHEALDEFQSEIATKLDKREMAPLKEFINKKLKMLHKKLKELSNVRRQAEAAAAKKDLLKDVTCVSCDLDAVMPRNLEGNVPVPPALTPHPNIKPYLTYELDMIRKENRRLPPKNVLRLEEALSSQKAKVRVTEGKPVISKGDHLCQRYCGGSHTTTLPHQRVTRVGNFVTCAGGGLEVFRLFPERGPGAKQDLSRKTSNGDTQKNAKHIKGNKK